MKLRTLISALFLGALALAGVPAASAQVITATIYGSVTDPSGAGIPGARVSVKSERMGASAATVTDSSGEFTLSSLQAGTYSVEIDADGFKSVIQQSLDLASGSRVRLAFPLELGTVSTAIEVSDAAPLINAVNAEQRTNIDSSQVRELPTTRRDWTGLLGLNPGVTVTSGTVSMNGLAPAAFRVTVDGTDSASDSELPSLSMYQNFNFIKGVSLEAVEEVNLVKGIASAEIANTMSGNVNINTKRGTNQFHGSLFELNQTENLSARNQFLTSKPALVYNQFGGSIGGPFIKNKLFGFGVYEGYRLRGFQTLQGNVPTPEFKKLAVAANPAYASLMDIYPNPTVGYAPNAVAAQFIGSGSEKGQDNHAVARVDYHVSGTTIVNARYTRGRPFRETPRVAAANYRIWTGRNEVASLNVTHYGAGWTSETRYGVNFNDVNRLDNLYALGIPGVGGGVPFGTDGETFFKEGQSQTIEQIFGTTRGRHSFRFGAMYGWLWGGRENIETPIARYANTADFLANRPNSVQVTFGVDSYRITTGSLGFFIQDDFRVTKRLIVNMGIRWDYYKVPRERDGRLFNREEPFGFGPYRPPNSIWDTDYNNFSPRIGFAYSVDGASTTVVRGGFGVFQNPRPLFGGPVDLVQNALDEPFRVVYSAADVAAHPDILRYPVVNSKVLPLAKGPAALLAGTAINPNWGNPFSYQWSAGLQKQLHRNTLIEASYVGTRGIGLMMVRTMNAPNRVTGIRPMTNFATFRYRDGSEQTNYHALQTSLRQRLTAGLTFNVNYTWSRNMSYTGDADLLLPGSPQDIWNVRGDYGPSNIDARHRFVVDYVYELPLEKLSSSNGAAARMLLRGWQISGVFSAQSGSPFNPSQPSGLDGSRPDYIGGEAILSDADSTLQYVNPAAFRQVPLNAVSRLPERGGSIGRNALYGPGWWDTNTTLAKAISITEQMRLQLRVEMLNALNHTSMSGVNGNVTQGNFGRFTSTRGARVIQVGARFSF